MIRIIIIVIVIALLFWVSRLVLLKNQVAKNLSYWQKRSQEIPKNNDFWLVVIGDSAAQGIGASSPQQGYVGLISASLQKKTSRPVHVVNLSINGAKTSDALRLQLPQFRKLKLPDDAVVLVEIGANNMAKFNAQSFRSDMANILFAMPAQAVVADIPYFGGGLFRSREEAVLQANAIVTELATKYNLRLAPLHEITKTKDSLLHYAADFFHPSNVAYKNWHDSFWQILNSD